MSKGWLVSGRYGEASTCRWPDGTRGRAPFLRHALPGLSSAMMAGAGGGRIRESSYALHEALHSPTEKIPIGSMVPECRCVVRFSPNKRRVVHLGSLFPNSNQINFHTIIVMCLNWFVWKQMHESVC